MAVSAALRVLDESRMAQVAPNQPVLPSLLDRLVRASGVGPFRPASVDEYRKEVVNDLRWLLNSRRLHRALPGPLDDTVLAFGLPDFSQTGLGDAHARDWLREALADTIRRFEPRLTDVRVRVDEAFRDDLRLRFQINAFLRVYPEPQPFGVDTLLDLTTQEFVMRNDE